MQGLLQQVPFSLPHLPEKPILLSLDSGAECSLEHWMEVYSLVEEEEVVIEELVIEKMDGKAAGWN